MIYATVALAAIYIALFILFRKRLWEWMNTPVPTFWKAVVVGTIFTIPLIVYTIVLYTIQKPDKQPAMPVNPGFDDIYESLGSIDESLDEQITEINVKQDAWRNKVKGFRNEVDSANTLDDLDRVLLKSRQSRRTTGIPPVPSNPYR